MSGSASGSPLDMALQAVNTTADGTSVIETQFDHWVEGFKQLGEDSEALDEEQPTLAEIQTALAETAAAQKSLKKSRVSIPFRGKKYPVFELVGFVTGWIKDCEGVIDKLVSLDVSGKAALPWAGIKFLLGVESTLLALSWRTISPC